MMGITGQPATGAAGRRVPRESAVDFMNILVADTDLSASRYRGSTLVTVNPIGLPNATRARSRRGARIGTYCIASAPQGDALFLIGVSKEPISSCFQLAYVAHLCHKAILRANCVFCLCDSYLSCLCLRRGARVDLRYYESCLWTCCTPAAYPTRHKPVLVLFQSRSP